MIIGICDDEKLYCDSVRSLAEKWQQKKHPELVLSVKSYETAEALAFDWAAGMHFDLLFLDIRLSSDSGLELAMRIRKTDPYVPIVFITSYAQYAVDGYEANAFRFLVKPLREDRVFPCLEHALSLLAEEMLPGLLAVRDGAHVRLPLSRIVSISCGPHQALITVADDTRPYAVRFRGSFEAFLQTAPAPYFVRCHNSHVINVRYMESFSRTELRMCNGQCFPISRAFAPGVLEHVRNHVSGGLA